MPLYTFENTETGEHFEKQMKIAEREDYLSANPHIRQNDHQSTVYGRSTSYGSNSDS